MNTFLPDKDFVKSAKMMDNLRLNKQTVEVKQIYNALTNPDAIGWKNHPATLMWKGSEIALLLYGWQMANEWVKRGFKTKLFYEFLDQLVPHRYEDIRYPSWLGDDRVHSSHRVSLLSKNFDWYRQWGWPETQTVLEWYEQNNWQGQAPYENYWPIKKEEKK